MLNVLRRVEIDILGLLKSEEGWNSKYIDYEPPTVERLWRDVGGGYRLFLHRIYPCEEPYFHPHPWPSAIRILSGQYEMGVGFGSGVVSPRCAARMILSTGDSYEMIDPDGWHWVRPLERPTLSLMVTGKPWDRDMPIAPPERPFLPVSNDNISAMLLAAQNYYLL